MKEVKGYKLGEEIPSAAKFITMKESSRAGVDSVTFYYEIKIKVEGQRKANNEAIGIAIRALTYLNKLTESHYTSNNKKTMDCIKARINDGAKAEDFQKVILSKYKEWTGTEMARNLVPSTLFGPKFQTYLEAAPMPEDKDNNMFAELADINQKVLDDHEGTV